MCLLKILILFNVKNINHKTIYDTLRRNKATSTGGDWIKKHFKEEEIAGIYTLSTRTKTNNKVKEMQYKIFNRYLATNTLLKKDEVERHSNVHFLRRWTRRNATPLLRVPFCELFSGFFFSNWWFLHTGAKIVFSYLDILFGYKSQIH